jgi:hypothetical protein
MRGRQLGARGKFRELLPASVLSADRRGAKTWWHPVPEHEVERIVRKPGLRWRAVDPGDQ